MIDTPRACAQENFDFHRKIGEAQSMRGIGSR
jgi:hypothetical protein